jgi:hypothetical protein
MSAMPLALSMLVCWAPATSHGAPPTPEQPPTPTTPEPAAFGEWSILDSAEGPDDVRGSSWKVRAERIVRHDDGWRLEGSVRAVSDTTIVATEHARLGPDELIAENASIYVDGARFRARIAKLDARTDRVWLDRPGTARPD